MGTHTTVWCDGCGSDPAAVASLGYGDIPLGWVQLSIPNTRFKMLFCFTCRNSIIESVSAWPSYVEHVRNLRELHSVCGFGAGPNKADIAGVAERIRKRRSESSRKAVANANRKARAK